MFAHLLQSTIFVAAIWLVTLSLRGNRARVRHALWMAASIKFLIPFSLFVSLGSQAVRRPADPVPPPQMRFVMVDSAPPPPLTIVPPAPVHRDWLPQALWLLWACGAAGILVRWYVRWRPVARARRESRAWTLPGFPVPIRSSASAIEPAAVGIFRPVLVLPEGIEQRLSAEQLDAILAHELCHVRHRDNLAAAIHMAVEAAFWFHPAIWWIGARLVDERERACDEEVLERGNDRAVYAESILQVCRLCLESPVACAAGIGGADLKARIRAIMTGGVGRRLRPLQKLLLATLAAGALAIPLTVGLLHPVKLRAQAPQTAPAVHFRTASVKLSDDQRTMEAQPRHPVGTFRWHAQLLFAVAWAYNVELWRMPDYNGPERHILNTMYDIEADTGPNVTEAQVRFMMQSLLTERFHMTVRRETKSVDGYALTLAKDGPKMQAAPDSEVPENDTWATGAVGLRPTADTALIEGHASTMRQLTDTLQRLLQTAVVDRTGLAGHYNFTVQYAEEGSDCTGVISGVKQIGLRLDKSKGPVEFLIIDHLDKLVEN